MFCFSYFGVSFRIGKKERQRQTDHISALKEFVIATNNCPTHHRHQIHVLKPNLQHDGTRRWDVIRSWGQDLHEWDQRPHKRDSRELPRPFPPRGHSQQMAVCALRSQTPNLPAPSLWTSRAPGLRGTRICCSSHRSIVFLLQQPA